MLRFKRFALSIFSLILFVSLPSFLFAGETGKIAGKVIDKNTGEPIIGANVFVDAVWVNDKEVRLATPQGSTSDIDGNFFILPLGPGDYNVKCSIIGFEKKEITKVRVLIDRTTEVNFEMIPQVIPSDEVVVTAYKPGEVEKDLTATKQTYNMSEIESIPGINSIADILTLQADVVDNHFRGGRVGEAQYLVSGGTINNPLDASRSFEPMTAGLQTVEVLTSGFSAEYGNAQSGVINMVPKEGGDKWVSKIDLSMDLPHYQDWSGNPYSINNYPLYNLLTNPEQWLVMFTDIGVTRPYFDKDSKYGSFITRKYPTRWVDSTKIAGVKHADSLRAARFGIANWKQATREIGTDDKSIPEHRLSITFGGPLTETIRLFIALQQEKGSSQKISSSTTGTGESSAPNSVPTALPDLRRQLMSNVTMQLSQKDKLSLLYSYNYTYDNANLSQDLSGTDFFNRIFQDPKTIKTSQQLAVKVLHQFNSTSFIDLSLQELVANKKTYPEFLQPGFFTNVNAYLGGSGSKYAYAGSWTAQPLSVNSLSTSRTDENTTTYSFDGSYSAQITQNNFLKTGLQFNSYILDVNDYYSMSDLSKYTQQTYRVYPYEGALFVQDKMEFQGLIANVGLRFDFYNFNYNYYSDIFNPLEYTSPDAAPKSKTKPFGRLQPRLGVSFPVTDRTVFHFNYGTFVQRPAFSYIYGGKIGFTGTTYTLSGIGNSTLKPEKTSAWDVGIVYALPGGVRIDLSAYYKDVSDLVEQATYQSLYPVVPSFTNYTNIDYATIKGFTINIDKNTQSFNFHLNYNYGISKGKSSGPTGQPIHIYRTATNFDSVALNTGVGTRDILLDYDRTHRLLTTMGFRTSNETGPSFLSLRPLSNINVSLTFTYNSGRPYSDPSGGDLTMFNLRSPDYYDLKIRVQKSFMIGSVKYILYVEGYNLTNFQGYSYSNIFDQKNMQDALLRWNNGERGSLEWYNPQYRESADREIASKEQYLYNVANAMYNNQPRYFRVGLSLEL